jgi:ribosome assembly protein RRB1
MLLFAIGDCRNAIHLWEPTTGGKWTVDNKPFQGHSASVEDLQWSPTEADVFASCSVDGTLRIWDTRHRKQSAISIKAHDADINVISWNRLASCMIASGCDDGTFRIWDLRSLKEDAFVAHFKYHKGAITSIEWSPHEASTLTVTSADHQLTYELFTPVNYCELPQLLRVHLLYVYSCILQSPTV